MSEMRFDLGTDQVEHYDISMLTPASHKSTWELHEMPYISAQYRAIVMLHRNSLLVGSTSGISLPANPLYNSISVGLGEFLCNISVNSKEWSFLCPHCIFTGRQNANPPLIYLAPRLHRDGRWPMKRNTKYRQFVTSCQCHGRMEFGYLFDSFGHGE